LSVRVPKWAHEEIAGIAAGAGVDERDLLAVNARTELLAGDECSVAVEGGVLAQNWDWHPDLAPSTLVWVVKHGDRWFATLTEAGMLAKIGLNSAGLGVCLNLLKSSADGGLDGVPIHVLLRQVLAECGSVDEAVALLCDARVSASSAVTLATAGEAATVELSPGAPAVLPGHVHTNHFLVPPEGAVDVGLAESHSTALRLEVMEGGGLGALRSHAGHPFGVCRHGDPVEPWEERSITLASVIMDLAERRLRVAEGRPCESVYEEIALPVPAS